MSASIIFLLKTFIIGIVEGITEFLPISSTGHMIIVGHVINFVGQGDTGLYSKAYIDMFEVVIQLGAILAIVVLYWNKIWNSLKNLMPGQWGFKLWSNMVIAMIPSTIIGLAFKKKIDLYLMDNVLAVAVAMIVGGALLVFVENKYRKKAKIKDIDDANMKQSFLIGVFQCLSLWPGMSRSASTIMGGWIVGLDGVAAAEFSFFLGIPTMFGATLLSVKKSGITTMDNMQVIGLAIGFLVSFIVALAVVDKFIGFLKKKPMRVFAVYRIVVGIALLGLFFAKVIA